MHQTETQDEYTDSTVLLVMKGDFLQVRSTEDVTLEKLVEMLQTALKAVGQGEHAGEEEETVETAKIYRMH